MSQILLFTFLVCFYDKKLQKLNTKILQTILYFTHMFIINCKVIIIKDIRHGFIVGCSIVTFSILAPVMWYLWIETGSANANFYFAITLVYSTAQVKMRTILHILFLLCFVCIICVLKIFLLTDILYAYLRRRLHLKHGLNPKLGDQEAKIVLD